eukprot:CAMPEP_0177652944 /NCGR_PEP_ID=MMETSP0447-20121125/13441_1 /TAXON_ID=0 /ORGANISM="Stygamoeba regulata, Strain BSH-02190019" /LENGTH=438 /DNA_ID=CAMNT_0019156305 /DNA_START=214 /DNA_END=1528 /DNA_ORIENTATION=+
MATNLEDSQTLRASSDSLSVPNTPPPPLKETPKETPSSATGSPVLSRAYDSTTPSCLSPTPMVAAATPLQPQPQPAQPTAQPTAQPATQPAGSTEGAAQQPATKVPSLERRKLTDATKPTPNSKLKMEDSKRIVRLNVGGRHFDCLLRTLSQLTQGKVKNILSEHWQEYEQAVQEKGTRVFFVDRDPDAFERIIRWLRTGESPYVTTGRDFRRLVSEVRFYKLEKLLRELLTPRMDGVYRGNTVFSKEELPRLAEAKQLFFHFLPSGLVVVSDDVQLMCPTSPVKPQILRVEGWYQVTVDTGASEFTIQISFKKKEDNAPFKVYGYMACSTVMILFSPSLNTTSKMAYLDGSGVNANSPGKPAAVTRAAGCRPSTVCADLFHCSLQPQPPLPHDVRPRQGRACEVLPLPTRTHSPLLTHYPSQYSHWAAAAAAAAAAA